MTDTTDRLFDALITRREAIRRVSALLGGVALVGGDALLTGCRDSSTLGSAERFTPDDVAFLDELSDTILPPTKTPGAKAAHTGAFMALMVTDAYGAADQKIFRQGMRTVDDASRDANGAPFIQATPAQRLAVLRKFDAEQKKQADEREVRQRASALKRLDEPLAARPTDEKKSGDAYLPDERKENAVGGPSGSGAAAITAEPPAHFFRMMKELALLGYFTSEIGCTQAQRYMESPGKFEPCIPYTPGEPAFAAHA
jgi:hypothetical protein